MANTEPVILVYLEPLAVALVPSRPVLTPPRLHPSGHNSPGHGWDLVKAALHIRSVKEAIYLFNS